jgi:hypothetical protein
MKSGLAQGPRFTDGVDIVLDMIQWRWKFLSTSIVGLNDGDLVATWPDSSGFGRDATQATEANRPTFKTGIFNGKPAVRWGQNSSQRLVTGLIAAQSQPSVTFAIGGGTGQTFFDAAPSASGRQTFYNPSAGLMYAGTEVNTGLAMTTAIWCFKWNGASSRVWRGGGSGSGSINVGTEAPNGLTLGNQVSNPNEGIGGDIGAFMVSNGDLDIGTINQVGNYLASWSGLSWTTAT